MAYYKARTRSTTQQRFMSRGLTGDQRHELFQRPVPSHHRLSGIIIASVRQTERFTTKLESANKRGHDGGNLSTKRGDAQRNYAYR
jgi:hypothetical protein